MDNFPTVTAMDAQRYQQLRELSRRHMSVLTKTIPREAYEEMGNALGIMRKGILILDTMEVRSVLMDSCQFDWVEGGKNLVEKYVEAHFTAPRTDDHLLFHAYCRAKYRLLMPEAISPGAATYWTDALSGKSIALMDIRLSQTMAHGFWGNLATRTVPLGSYWMTTGAGLPVSDKKAGEKVIKTIRARNLFEDATSAGEHKLAAAIIRACLDSGAAQHIRYETGEEEEKEVGAPRIIMEVKSGRRHIDRNDPCRCGSGKRYRRCCMHK